MKELAEIVAELAEAVAKIAARDGKCPLCGDDITYDTYMCYQRPHDETCLVSRAEKLARESERSHVVPE